MKYLMLSNNITLHSTWSCLYYNFIIHVLIKIKIVIQPPNNNILQGYKTVCHVFKTSITQLLRII